MRVTGGTARGVTLVAPRGLETRPTSDRVREAIFSILYSMDADLTRVLDLYAGTGALAIEALSRGAASADLVERATPACAAIRRNLASVRMAERARLHCMDVRQALTRLGPEPFTVVFLDPPYADPMAADVLAALGGSGLLAAGTTLVLEHATRRPPPESVGALALDSDRRYGDTGVAFYR
jgi:16S rRNA (guanine966-N2)-methyltransferase